MDDLEQDLKELELLESSKTSKNKIIIIPIIVYSISKNIILYFVLL